MRRLLRFTLDLFDPGEAAPAQNLPRKGQSKPPGDAKTAFSKQNSGNALVQRSFDAINNVVNQPAEPAYAVVPLAPLQSGAPAPGYRHPKANREALLVGAAVGYELKRARRKTIGFAIVEDGLVVTAPLWVPIGQIELALHEKAGWIVRKLGESRTRLGRAEQQRIVWCDGATLPFRGGLVTLRLDAAGGKRGAARLDPGESRVLRVALAVDVPPERIRNAVQAFLMAEARRVFSERLDHFARLVGVRWTRLSLSNAATRWGSASSNGSIRLHWRLIQMTPALLDYVVVHELAHLKHMNHSPRFWGLVSQVLPDQLALRKELKGVTLPRWI